MCLLEGLDVGTAAVCQAGAGPAVARTLPGAVQGPDRAQGREDEKEDPQVDTWAPVGPTPQGRHAPRTVCVKVGLRG